MSAEQATADVFKPTVAASFCLSASRILTYEIFVEEPLLDSGNPRLIEFGVDRSRRVVVVDRGIPARLQVKIADYFAAWKIDAQILHLPGGEASKTWQQVDELIHAFERFRLNRRTQPIIAFGGGAVLDTVGFAASIYRRGVPFVRVPTTLLAYVDAAIGLKTGINVGGSKNLVGSFAPPMAVFLDRAFLHSLDPAEVASGAGELLKLGVGCDERLLSSLEEHAADFGRRAFDGRPLFNILLRSIEIMVDELSSNPFEDNLARAVDLGHTISQPLEMAHGGRLRHGEAVAVDVNLSAIIAAQRGFIRLGDALRVWKISKQLNLPMTLGDLSVEDLWSSILERTLHRGGHQNVPIPAPLGRCTFINDLSFDELESAVREFKARSS